MRYEEFLAKCDGVKPSGEGHVAQCPAHDDQRHSLSLAFRDGKILLRCHANKGCTAESIVAAVGLTMRDLFLEEPVPGRRERARVVATYRYVDEQDALLYEAVRLDPKSFYQRRPNGRGGWINNLKDVPRRVLYRLPELKAAP